MNPSLIILTERFVGVLFLALGVSHIVNARAWSALFAALASKAWVAPLVGAATFPFGLAIVLLHNVWVVHFALLTTLVGWGYATFGGALLVTPASAPALLRPWSRTGWLRGVGAALLIVGGAICLGAFMPPT